ncbi:MAG: glycosyltransferase family 2 protein [Anaerolineales bacterium]|nr:glycosyltransferase family 2 protein [Anaerolineales bacterium]
MTTLDLLFIPVTVIYFLVVTTLFIYGLNFLYLSYHAWKRRDALTVEPLPLKTDSLPFVTVQLPIYNELYVAERLIEAAASLDYPPSRFEIQVLDDSTDETVSLVARSVDRVRARGVQIHHLHRTDRQGFKAGALAHGLQTAQGEFIAVFDADFVPRPDFLKRLLPYFDADDIAFVQARWGHLNGGYSLLTFLQSLSLDAHFAVEQLARSQLGLWFNFNGTAGVWRKAAIVDSGGWKAETLTEDLDLSYRAFLRGWRARYAGEVEAPSELPVSFTAFRRQQHRWAHGGFDCAIRYIPQIWKSDASLARKIQASLHLTGYLIHLLLFACVFLYPLVVAISERYTGLISLFGVAVVFNFTALAPIALVAVAQNSLRKRWLSLLPYMVTLAALGAGLMLNTLRAAWQVWAGRRGAFERTPKYGITARAQKWESRRYYVKVDWLVLFEIILALFNVGTVWLAIQNSNWLIALYAAIFAAGLFFNSGLTILQAIQRRFPSPITADSP